MNSAPVPHITAILVDEQGITFTFDKPVMPTTPPITNTAVRYRASVVAIGIGYSFRITLTFLRRLWTQFHSGRN